ncbi:MAG: hypothetical protein ACRDD2_08895 [Sarcina sp.]
MLVKVFALTANTMAEMGELAHSLGNRHLPAEFKDGKMLLKCDPKIEEILKSNDIKYSVEEIELEKPFRDIEGDHIH